MKYNIIILHCKNCGNTLETDLPVDQALLHRCGKCDANEWQQKHAGKAISRDATAPTELIAEQEGTDAG